ncbi:MAG: 50S ribosomal protein L17 [Candidatus Levyibacteriota bacterium]
MRKRVFGRKLKRTTNQRKALFKSLTNALVLHGRIKTTEAKAKSVKGEIEKLVTKAKKDEKLAMQNLQKNVQLKTAERLIKVIAPVFKDRPGGYTRIVRMGNRKKDNAPMVILEFVEQIEKVVVSPKREKKAVVVKATAKPATTKAKAVVSK